MGKIKELIKSLKEHGGGGHGGGGHGGGGSSGGHGGHGGRFIGVGGWWGPYWGQYGKCPPGYKRVNKMCVPILPRVNKSESVKDESKSAKIMELVANEPDDNGGEEPKEDALHK